MINNVNECGATHGDSGAPITQDSAIGGYFGISILSSIVGNTNYTDSFGQPCAHPGGNCIGYFPTWQIEAYNPGFICTASSSRR